MKILTITRQEAQANRDNQDDEPTIPGVYVWDHREFHGPFEDYAEAVAFSDYAAAESRKDERQAASTRWPN